MSTCINLTQFSTCSTTCKVCTVRLGTSWLPVLETLGGARTVFSLTPDDPSGLLQLQMYLAAL